MIINENNGLQQNPYEQYKTEHAPSLQGVANVEIADKRFAGVNIAARKGRLSCVVGSIKATVTKYANEHSIPFCWQERFYDRVIRKHSEMQAYQHYIDNNVINWILDECNPDNTCRPL